jgi:hypothetical protein
MSMSILCWTEITHETHMRVTRETYLRNHGDTNVKFQKVRSPYGWLYWMDKRKREEVNN